MANVPQLIKYATFSHSDKNLKTFLNTEKPTANRFKRNFSFLLIKIENRLQVRYFSPPLARNRE
ncbi:MAG: hypothetical protein ACJA1I_000906 [Zhongshania marina]|jgi:hypothetical protein